MVSIDIYVNETTRHADVILPSPSPLEKAHFDFIFQGFSVRNYANYSPRGAGASAGMPDEWETVLRLVGVVTGQGAGRRRRAIDEFVARAAIGNARSPTRTRRGTAATSRRRSPSWRRAPARARLIDLMLRTGPYGLTLADLERQAARHRPRGAAAAAARGAAHAERADRAGAAGAGRRRRAPARRARRAPPTDELVLVGRRDLRSNNSWMHNLPMLVRGPERCTLHVHPDDAERLGLADGAPRDDPLARRRAKRARRGHRRHPARRRLAAARLGPRRGRRRDGRRARPRRASTPTS